MLFRHFGQDTILKGFSIALHFEQKNFLQGTQKKTLEHPLSFPQLGQRV